MDIDTLDISQGKIGKLDAATNTFVIDETVGELEFEAEESELTLTVTDLNGEWAVFIPTSAAGAGATTGAATGGAGAVTAITGNAQSIVQSLLGLLQGGTGGANLQSLIQLLQGAGLNIGAK
jgi:hypothetical protein